MYGLIQVGQLSEYCKIQVLMTAYNGRNLQTPVLRIGFGACRVLLKHDFFKNVHPNKSRLVDDRKTSKNELFYMFKFSTLPTLYILKTCTLFNLNANP